MPGKSKRTHRTAELIQKIIALALLKEVSDPRLSKITITGVDLSPDFKQAIVFFSMLDPTDEFIQSAENAFKKAEGFFRLLLSRSTELRHTPKLFFRYDMTPITAERISDLLRE
ncbi:MAG: ribosome-binding factor A [Gammaproteobacteria bacterium RIFCSPHIGHO2_12_FULL_38_11]|nr:MAG: ribosome-binding factor A [Gammaproteobacteria bacterium RIFCSPHIGHO2_12_FULL_38_11]